MRFSLIPCLLALALTAPGCADDHAPSQPGGGGGGGGGGGSGGGNGADAGTATDAASFAVIGGICVIDDLRFPDQCATGNLGGITIAVLDGPDRTQTASNGQFILALSTGAVSALTLQVGASSVTLHPSLVPVLLDASGANNVLVPIVTADAWSELVAATVASEPDSSGAIAAYLLAGTPPTALVGGEVVQPQQSVFAPFYDDGARLSWSQVGLTRTSGAALLFGVPTSAPTVSFTAIGAGGAPTRSFTVPVRAGHTTFAFADLTP